MVGLGDIWSLAKAVHFLVCIVKTLFPFLVLCYFLNLPLVCFHFYLFRTTHTENTATWKFWNLRIKTRIKTIFLINWFFWGGIFFNTDVHFPKNNNCAFCLTTKSELRLLANFKLLSHVKLIWLRICYMCSIPNAKNPNSGRWAICDFASYYIT